VEIPGFDGRAGMAAVVVNDGFDLAQFRPHIAQRLPVYAHPVFVRISAALDFTETFKQKKQQLMSEGFDPRLVTDPLFYRDPATGDYRPIDAAAYAEILQGAIRL
jgi:fatty-acyl-CoA synthase